jgi:hypothetical protein
VITFDVDDVIGRGVLHDRERVPLGLHGVADTSLIAASNWSQTTVIGVWSCRL